MNSVYHFPEIMMRKTLLSVLFAVLLTSCATSGSSQLTPQEQEFVTWVEQIAREIQATPTYRRIPLDTQAQTEEFELWMFNLYTKKITGQQFSDIVVARYPGFEESAQFIVDRLPQPPVR